jgi:hypothetical protein
LSLAEKELLSEVDKVMAQYKLLFACVIDVVNSETGVTTKQLVYLTLTDQFKAFLQTVKLNKATVTLQSHIQAHIELIGSSPLLMDGLSCLKPQMFDSVFSLSLHKFAWAVELPTVNRESVKDLLGIYHFAKMRKGSYSYQKRIKEGRVCIRQENIEEDKSKRDKKVTELYNFGLMKSRKDVLAMLANFYAFAKYVVKDFDSTQPMLWTALLQVAKILRSPEGRTWGEYHRRHPEAFHNIAIWTCSKSLTASRISPPALSTAKLPKATSLSVSPSTTRPTLTPVSMPASCLTSSHRSHR